MRNKTRSLSNLCCRSSCVFPGTVLFTFAALFITRTLLFNTNSVSFSRFSSFERLPSITVVSERFSSTSAAFAALFIVCKFSRFFYHLHFPCALLTSFTPLLPPPSFGPRCAFPFFSSFAHTSHSLSFSRAFCHSRLLHPSLYLHCHKTAEIKFRCLAFLA